MQLEFLDVNVLIGFNVEGKESLLVDGYIVVKEIAGDGFSENFVDDEEVANAEVDLFDGVVVGFER